MKRTVFVDSSVLFSASNSPTGGSAKLFILTSLGLISSNVVLTETERNIRKKLTNIHLERFFHLVSKVQILDSTPNIDLIQKAKNAIVEKDAVILAEVKQAKTDFLVTLDRKHFFTSPAKSFVKPTIILTPKDLINRVEK